MSKRVIVPLDRTERSEVALERLPQFCEKGDEVILITVGEAGQPLQRGFRPGRIVRGDVLGPAGGVAGASRPDLPVYVETRDQTIQRQLDELADYLKHRAVALEKVGFNVEMVVEISEHPAQAIIDLARRCEPTFIMMVRTTHPRLGERLFGTVAQQVIREEVAPVMILPVKTAS